MSSKRTTKYRPTIEYGHFYYACKNGLREAEDEGMGNYGKHALEGTPACSQCADKDIILAGLRRINAQLASECDRLRALAKQPKGHSHHNEPTFVCAYCEREAPSNAGLLADLGWCRFCMDEACDACWSDMVEARRAEAQNQ